MAWHGHLVGDKRFDTRGTRDTALALLALPIADEMRTVACCACELLREL